MKCENCKYYELIDGTIFCNSKNGKKKVVRIEKWDAERDIDCLWSHDKNELKYECV